MRRRIALRVQCVTGFLLLPYFFAHMGSHAVCAVFGTQAGDAALLGVREVVRHCEVVLVPVVAAHVAAAMALGQHGFGTLLLASLPAHAVMMRGVAGYAAARGKLAAAHTVLLVVSGTIHASRAVGRYGPVLAVSAAAACLGAVLRAR